MKRILLALMMTAALSACEKGEKGDPGNANVIGTNAATYYPSDWIQTTSGTWLLDIAAPDITQDVVDYGLVMVYIKANANTWTALPATIDGTEILFSISPATITVEMNNSTPVGALTFRAVIVPSNARKANPGVNWYNYEEVKKLQGIREVSLTAGAIKG